jgi:hypothetical protein
MTTDTPGRPTHRFFLGVGMMAMSFLIYPGYALIPFLPVSGSLMVGIVVVASVVSWTLFGLGALLAGKEGYPYLKAWGQCTLRRLFPRRSA